LAHIETTMGVEVFVEEELTDDQMQMLYQSILSLSNVASAEFVHPDDALAALADQLGDTEGLIGSLLYDNPLRRSFQLELVDIRQQRETVEAIWLMHGVGNIIDASDASDWLTTANNYIGIFSIVVIIILGVLAVVIITNTIKLTVNNRRNEILIMRYVGATDWFIKWPFVIEGVMIGIIGAAISLTISWFSYEGIISSLENSQLIETLELPFLSTTDLFPIFAPMAIVIGALIGILGSISSMRKYLSV